MCRISSPHHQIDTHTQKQKAHSLSLLIPRDESSLGSCPSLCLPREVIFLCTERKIRERFCFARFNSSITEDNKVRLSSRLGEPELASPSGGDSVGRPPCPGAQHLWGRPWPPALPLPRHREQHSVLGQDTAILPEFGLELPGGPRSACEHLLL